MVKHKRQTRSSTKKPTKNNSPSRAHKRKQRRVKGVIEIVKEPSFSPDPDHETDADEPGTELYVPRTHKNKQLFKTKTTGLQATDNDKSADGTVPTRNKNRKSPPNDHDNNLQPKALFVPPPSTAAAKPIDLTDLPDDAITTLVVINADNEIIYNDADIPKNEDEIDENKDSSESDSEDSDTVPHGDVPPADDDDDSDQPSDDSSNPSDDDDDEGKSDDGLSLDDEHSEKSNDADKSDETPSKSDNDDKSDEISSKSDISDDGQSDTSDNAGSESGNKNANATPGSTNDNKDTSDDAMDEDKDDDDAEKMDDTSSHSTPINLAAITKTTPGRSNLKKPKTPTRNMSVTLSEQIAPLPQKNNTRTKDHRATPDPNLPTLPDMKNECRYSMIITVPPSTAPWPKYVEILRKCFKLIQKELNTHVWIASWDPESDVTTKILKSPKDIPEGKATNRKLFSHYFSGFPNPKKNQASKVFMKVRFILQKPETLPISLSDMGSALSETLSDDLPVQLGRQPYACQAVKSECICWFYGSVKQIDSLALAKKVIKAMKLPRNVAIGLQWRSMKDELGKNYPWNKDDPPPQALHLDMDHNYAAAYSDTVGKLWRKGSSVRVGCLQLRAIPCFGSARAIGLSDEQKMNCLLMSAKQQYFVNSHTHKPIENAHILSLDAEVEGMTLRRYLMSRAPKNEILQRLFVTADKAWRGGMHCIITVKPYAAEAVKALDYMIPECVHLYGQEAANLWFTSTGLLAFQNVKWDPRKRSTTSTHDRETKALVEENLFGIGTDWQNDTALLRGKAQRPSTAPGQPLPAVQAALHSRSNDDDVRSFGSLYGRQPDEPPTTTTTDANGNPTDVVVFFNAQQQERERNEMKDDQSFDASSAGFTTGSTRSKLREQEQVNAILRDQMLQLNAINQQKDDELNKIHDVDVDDDDSNKTEKTTQSTRQQLAVALAALQLLQEQQATAVAANDAAATAATRTNETMAIDPPPPKDKAPAPVLPTDTVTGGVGKKI
jgi:hypothetical protein